MSNWIWMGHQAHLIVRCRFHLATVIDEKYIVSTVGDYFDHEGKRNSIGRTDNQFFETYVFNAVPLEGDDCCPYQPDNTWMELEGQRYTTGLEASKGHIEFCEKYSHKES